MIMNNLDAVSAALKNFVMTADHFGKDEDAGPRGTSVKITSPPTLFYMKGGTKTKYHATQVRAPVRRV